jgi:hypothetical protein
MKFALLAALVLVAATTIPAWADMTCRADGLGGVKCEEDDSIKRVLRQADRLLDQGRHKVGRIRKTAAPRTGRHAEERRARERHKLEMEERRLRLQQIQRELSR